MSSKILLRRGTSAEWSSANPILQVGELGIDLTLNKLKAGNGTSLWTSLPYINILPSELSELAQDAVESAITAGTGITKNYNDTANTITLAVDSTIANKTYVDTAVSGLGSTAAESYVPLSIVGSADGVASLDPDGKIPDSEIPSTIARDSEVTSAISTEVTNRNSAISTAVNNLINSAPGTLDTLGEIATALAADESVAAALTTVVNSKAPLASPTFTGTVSGINKSMVGLGSVDNTADSAKPISSATQTALDGKVSKAGGDTITASAAGVVGLAIKGATSQTANLTEWQNSAGTVLAKVNSIGDLNAKTFSNSGANQNYLYNFSSLNGTGGNLSFNSTSYGLLITVPQVAAVVLQVKGAASQTANLQEWQNSAGTVLVKVDASGNLDLPNGGIVKSYYFAKAGSGSAVLTLTGDDNIQFFNAAGSRSGAGNIFISNTGTAPSSNPTGGGALYVDAGALKYRGTSNAAQQIVGADGSVSFVTPTASTVGLIVKGAASQTANLQEWQNSAGTVLASIASSGYITVPGIVSGSQGIQSQASVGINISNFTSSSQLAVATGGASYLGIIVRGATSQTGNLQEWQNSAGTVRSAINANGFIIAGNSTVISNAIISAQPYGSTQVGVAIRGAASQTANLQEWQDSAGTVLAKVNATGALTSSGDMTITNGAVTLTVNQVVYSPGYSVMQFGSSIKATNSSLSSPTFIVQGPASQTANLQEWQNSAGTVLAKVDSAGVVYPNAIVSTSGNANSFGGNFIAGVILSVYTNNAVGQIIRGAGSQTNDLQQWQNSAGTVLSKVDSTGAMFTITPVDSTNTTQVATTAYVKNNINNLINSAPGALDTLNELAAALGNDASFSTTITNSLALKAPLASPTFTGTVSGITKTMVGLGNVDNTTDANKPVSTATQTALDLKNNSAITINSQTSNYTILLADYNKLIEMSAGGTLTITDSASFPVGFTCDILQTGTSQVTIAGTSFTPNATPGLKLRAQWSSATLIKRALNSWVVLGDLSA